MYAYKPLFSITVQFTMSTEYNHNIMLSLGHKNCLLKVKYYIIILEA